jgi:hypothetical protein
LGCSRDAYTKQTAQSRQKKMIGVPCRLTRAGWVERSETHPAVDKKRHAQSVRRPACGKRFVMIGR